MANAPLNAPPGTNNLLALALEQACRGRGDVMAYDTGEPTTTTVTVTTATVVQVNFPLTGVGVQPTVIQGALALILTPISTTTVITSCVIEAVDSTATNAGHTEQVANIVTSNQAVLGDPIIDVRTWASSLAAGTDKVGSLTNVVGMRLTLTVQTTGGGVKVQFVATGTM